MTTTGSLRVEGRMPSLDGGTGWLNTEPLTADGLRGRVVLVQFWTYTCINWLRTLPHVRAWAATYGEHGLVVLGVHTPEFSFEADGANVRRAAARAGVTYPVLLDADHVVWDAFDNGFWPALYFVDATGRIRHHWFGEGEYERSEQVIQELLTEAGAGPLPEPPVPVAAEGVEAPADWDDLASEETYLGFGRAAGFASRRGLVRGAPHAYEIPSGLRPGHWALSGTWRVESEAAVSCEPGARVAVRFHARDVHLVMGAVMGAREPAADVPFRVLLDGRPPGVAAGGDVRDDGRGGVAEPRLYQLIRQPGPVRDRLLEIEFSRPGVEVVVFTFG